MLGKNAHNESGMKLFNWCVLRWVLLIVGISVVGEQRPAFAKTDFSDATATLSKTIIERHVRTMYSANKLIRRRSGPVLYSVAGYASGMAKNLEEVAHTLSRYSGLSLAKTPEGQTPGMTILLVKNMPHFVLSTEARDVFTTPYLTEKELTQRLLGAHNGAGNSISRYRLDKRGHLLVWSMIIAETDFQNRGRYVPPLRYLMQLMLQSMVGGRGSDVIQSSVMYVGADVQEVNVMPLIDTALLHTLYSHDNWHQLAFDQAVQQMTDGIFERLQEIKEHD